MINTGCLSKNVFVVFITFSENTLAENLNAVTSRGVDQEAVVAVCNITWTDALR